MPWRRFWICITGAMPQFLCVLLTPLKASNHVNCEKLFYKLYNWRVPKSLVRILSFWYASQMFVPTRHAILYISCTLVNIILSLTDPALSTVTFYLKLCFSLHVNLWHPAFYFILFFLSLLIFKKSPDLHLVFTFIDLSVFP